MRNENINVMSSNIERIHERSCSIKCYIKYAIEIYGEEDEQNNYDINHR